MVEDEEARVDLVMIAERLRTRGRGGGGCLTREERKREKKDE